LKVKAYIDRVLMLDPKNHTANLLLAIWFFVESRNIDAAVASLSNCRDASDPTWRLSLAFLRAYQGNLTEAIRLYRKVHKRGFVPSIIFEIEEFMCWVLDSEPDKIQLFFCLGYINWKGKGDLSQAKGDFETFLAMRKEGDFQDAARLANAYLIEIAANLRKYASA